MPSAINLANIVQDQAEVTEQEYTYLNMAAMYILARVTSSQCMGLGGSGFKNMKSSRTMLARRFPALPIADPPLDELPYITHQTVAYAFSLVMSCVCYSFNDPMTKGHASQVYEKILANYSKLSDKEFQNVLRANLTDCVFKATTPEPPRPQVPVMSMREVAAADRGRPSSAAAAAATTTDESGGEAAAEGGSADAEEDGAEEEEEEGEDDGNGGGAADGDGDGAADGNGNGDGDGDGDGAGDDGSEDGETSSKKTTSSPGQPRRGNNAKKPAGSKPKPD
jgi:hypothetical protein